MSRIVTAVFDGQNLRFDAPLELEPNTRYRVTLEAETATESAETAWDVLARYAGTVDAPADWSSEHDHYLYGTPKRHTDSSP